MADHAVGGVDRFVGGEARQTEHEEPEGRCDDAVGCVLGKTFDRRPRDAMLVERLRIASDDAADRIPRSYETFRGRGRLLRPERDT